MKRGFTLIELLVVIAIIGVLASIALVSLSNARTKGKDAAVKSQVASIRNQAELYLVTQGVYETGGGESAGVCEDPQVIRILQNIDPDYVGSDSGGDIVECNDTPTTWVVVSDFFGSTTIQWCADYLTVSKEIPTNPDPEALSACP